jgi:hypothetical protein
MSVVQSVRRYYLGKRIQAALDENWALVSVWKQKQEAESGTPLPVDFTELAALAEAGYSTSEDLTGATTEELVWAVGFSLEQATNVLSALAAL